LIALGLSSLGDWLGLLATTALAQQLGAGYSGKAYAIGAVLALRLIPALFFGPFAGAVADRLNRRLTMVIADVIRCSLFISIPIVHTLPWLLVASFLIECASLFWIPAKEASVPNLVPPEHLEAANQLSLIATYGSAAPAAGIFAILSSLSRALGSGIPFFHTNPVSLALYFDAVTFLFSAGTVFTLRMIGKAARSDIAPYEGIGAGARGLLVDMREGFAFVRQDRFVRGLVVGILGGFTGAGCVVALGRLYVEDLGGGDAGYGLLFGAVFLGLAAGMAGGPGLLGPYSRKRLFGIAVMGAGGALCVVALLPNLVLAIFVVLVVGAFAGIAWVTGYTLVGLEVADEVRGRTFALIQSLVRIDLLMVLAVAPFVAGLIGPRSIKLPNGSHIRADGVTIVLLVGGLVMLVVGHLAFREMDDRPGVAVLPELWASVRGRRTRGPARPYPGFFLVFEGGEGAGKSTQVQAAAAWFAARGLEVVSTREPGATAVGRRLRALLLDPEVTLSPRSEALLYAADRAEHVATIVRPALARGAAVISDRYVDSSLAYQGAGRDLEMGAVAQLSEWATGDLVPDLTVLLDLPPEVGLARAQQRGGHDRLEREQIEFHERVRAHFLQLAEKEPSRYAVIDATAPVARVTAQVLEAVAAAVPSELVTGDSSRQKVGV
jgi:dTMP kinase